MGWTILGIIGFIWWVVTECNKPSDDYSPPKPKYTKSQIDPEIKKIADRILSEPVCNKTPYTPKNTTVPMYDDNEYSHPTWFISDWARTLKPSPAEQLIIDSLSRYPIKWYREVSFYGCKLPSSTSSIPYARFDFFIPSINTVIEYHGKDYHSSPEQIENDQYKKNYLSANLINLVVWDRKDYYHIDRRINDLLQKHLN